MVEAAGFAADGDIHAAFAELVLDFMDERFVGAYREAGAGFDKNFLTRREQQAYREGRRAGVQAHDVFHAFNTFRVGMGHGNMDAGLLGKEFRSVTQAVDLGCNQLGRFLAVRDLATDEDRHLLLEVHRMFGVGFGEEHDLDAAIQILDLNGRHHLLRRLGEELVHVGDHATQPRRRSLIKFLHALYRRKLVALQQGGIASEGVTAHVNAEQFLLGPEHGAFGPFLGRGQIVLRVLSRGLEHVEEIPLAGGQIFLPVGRTGQ